MDVERYRMIAANLISKAESKGNLIRIAASLLEETSKRRAQKLKDDAVSHFNGEEKVKEIHLRIAEVRWMKEIEKERKEDLETKENEEKEVKNEEPAIRKGEETKEKGKETLEDQEEDSVTAIIEKLEVVNDRQ